MLRDLHAVALTWLLGHQRSMQTQIKRIAGARGSAPSLGPMTPPIEAAKARLTELEVRLPWTSVKKSWGPRREQWVSQVLAIVTSEALGAQLLSLEVRVLCALRPTCSHIQCAGDPPARTGLQLFTPADKLPGLISRHCLAALQASRTPPPRPALRPPATIRPRPPPHAPAPRRLPSSRRRWSRRGKRRARGGRGAWARHTPARRSSGSSSSWRGPCNGSCCS